MRKILVPIDFSPTSAVALRYAGFLANLTGDALAVIHVQEAPEGGALDDTAGHRRVADFVRQHLSAPPLHGMQEHNRPPRMELLTVPGDAPTVLLALSRDLRIRLIVMGDVGMGQLLTPGECRTGSVARTVALLAEAALLRIPQGFGAPGSTLAPFSAEAVHPIRMATEAAAFLLEALQRVSQADFPGFPLDLNLLQAGPFSDSLADQVLRYDVELLIHYTLEVLCGRLNNRQTHRPLPPEEIFNLAA